MGGCCSSGVDKGVGQIDVPHPEQVAATVGREDIPPCVPEDRAAKIYAQDMRSQWDVVLQNPDNLIHTAASRVSPFKFHLSQESGPLDVSFGSSAVALPDGESDFGRRYAMAVENVQDLCQEYLGGACKRQTVAHMSIGAVLLEKHTPEEYNEAVLARSGLMAKVKAELDGLDPPIRAKIETLKITPDGCVAFQLRHDPAQDVTLTEAKLDEALQKIPTCHGDAAAGEKKRFTRKEDGTFFASRFQQVRLALGALGCEIKGMYPSGHMVVVNLVDPELAKAVPLEKLDELWAKCHSEWSSLLGEWFELRCAKCFCYVERSLNQGSVVVPPLPGSQPIAYPESSPSAHALMDGVFVANSGGDVLIHLEKFHAKASSEALGEWGAFSGEVAALAEMSTGIRHLVGKHPRELLLAEFFVYDIDGNGAISVDQFRQVMEKLGEMLSDEQAKDMIKVTGKDGNGTVDYKEFVDIMSPQKRTYNKKLFDAQAKVMMKVADKDESGTVDYKEFVDVMSPQKRTYNKKIFDDQSKDLTNVASKDGNGTVDYNEFVDIMSPQKKRTYNKKLSDAQAKDMMKVADKDGNGTVDYTEFVDIMSPQKRTYNKKRFDEQAKELVKVADKDGNGTVDYTEFVDIMSPHQQRTYNKIP